MSPWGWGWGKGKWFWRGWGPWPVQAVQVELPPGSFPLSAARPGSRVVVKAILAGWGGASEAASLGLTPGAEVEVVENNMAYPWSPVVVSVGGVRVALGRGLASKIIVVEKTGQQGQASGASPSLESSRSP
ncbi:FeoA family protein [Stetteria hydrogenophila]